MWSNSNTVDNCESVEPAYFALQYLLQFTWANSWAVYPFVVFATGDMNCLFFLDGSVWISKSERIRTDTNGLITTDELSSDRGTCRVASGHTVTDALSWYHYHMPTVQALHATIRVDGKDIPEYDLQVDDKEKQVSCWIPSEAGKVSTTYCSKVWCLLTVYSELLSLLVCCRAPNNRPLWIFDTWWDLRRRSSLL